MNKINDHFLFFYAALVTLVVSFILGSISFYSILIVEKKIETLLTAKNNIEKNYRKAYLLLKKPQFFAQYDRFDSEGLAAKNSINFFDKKIASSSVITLEDKKYLEILLDRRKKGSTLGAKTMVYFLIISLVSWLLYFKEKKL